MSTRRLHVAELGGPTHEVTGADHHYLFRVLRMRPGDEVILFDGNGYRALATVTEISADAATLSVGAIERAPAPPRPRITVVLSLIKGDRMEWCVQKLVELGADAIVPVSAARSVVKLDGARAEKRRAKLESIATDAARQCERATVPEIAAIAPLRDALDACDAEAKLLVWERARDVSVASALVPAPASVALVIGPEGGLAEDEVDHALDAGFVPVGLGPRTLRAETAAIAAVCAVQVVVGDLQSI